MNKLKSLLLIFILTSTLFAADDLLTKSKWQISNEYTRKDNVYFYDSYGNSDNQESKFPIYLKEFLYASGGSACCLGTPILVAALLPPPTIEVETIPFYIPIFVATPNFGPEYIIPAVGFLLAIILQPAIAATGTREAAKEINPGGSFGISCLCATGGLIAGCGLGLGTGYIIDKAFYKGPYPSFEYKHWWLAIPLAFLGNSIGAVIGYNLSVPKRWGGFSYQHFDLPSFSMKTEKTQEGKTIATFDFRLINARF